MEVIWTVPYCAWRGVGFVYCLPACDKGRQKALFMVFAYAVQLLPWILVPRCTFAYHYFPSVPFVAMMIVYGMVKLVDADKNGSNGVWFIWQLPFSCS